MVKEIIVAHKIMAMHTAGFSPLLNSTSWLFIPTIQNLLCEISLVITVIRKTYITQNGTVGRNILANCSFHHKFRTAVINIIDPYFVNFVRIKAHVWLSLCIQYDKNIAHIGS